jgi:hypothetical protein
LAKNEVKITGTKEAQDNLLKEIRNAVTDERFMRELAEEAIDQIKKRTRGRQEQYKQDKLEKSTIGARKRLIERGNAFDPAIVRAETSNLSMSGQLLNSMRYKLDEFRGIITLFINPDRELYKDATLQETIDKKDNIEIKEELEKRNRKFFFISDRLKANLQNRIADGLRRSLKLYDKIKRK